MKWSHVHQHCLHMTHYSDNKEGGHVHQHCLHITMTIRKGGHIYLNTNCHFNTRPSTQICVQCHLSMYCHIPQHKPTHSHLYPMSLNKAYRHLHQHKAFHSHLYLVSLNKAYHHLYQHKAFHSHLYPVSPNNTHCHLRQHKATHSHLYPVSPDDTYCNLLTSTQGHPITPVPSVT